jgi:hypothetical protein
VPEITAVSKPNKSPPKAAMIVLARSVRDIRMSCTGGLYKAGGPLAAEG